MLVKILGAIDLIGGLILLFLSGFNLPTIFLIILGVILIIKSSFGLWKNFASWTDLISGIIFILFIFFPVHWIICLILGILLIQKGIFSFL